MSRIGKKEIIVPNNTIVEINKSNISIKGNQGLLSYKLPSSIEIDYRDNKIKLYKRNESKKAQELYGLARSLVNNMIIGVSEGFSKKLIIQGVGYRAQVQGKNLILNVGYSHPVIIEPPQDIKITVEGNNIVIVSGINKTTVGQIAATIRSVRPPEPYKSKGIKYENEIIRRKVGKAGK